MALREELQNIDELQFIFTSPTFTKEKSAKEKREALEKRIAQLEDQLRRECQPRKKFELHQTIMNLKKQL